MPDVEVTNNPARHRYEARVDGDLVGFADYQLATDLIVFDHTEVDHEFEGQGIGGALIQQALDDVRADGTRKVLPTCPFVKVWIQKHPDYVPLLHGVPSDRAADEGRPTTDETHPTTEEI